MHKFHITSEGPGYGRVYMDGKPVEGVVEVRTFVGLNQMTQVQLTMNTNQLSLELEGADVEVDK